MTTTGEQKAAARRLVLAITRAGFSQLRKTSNGYLYGSGTFRMELPYAVVQGSASLAYVAELHQRFDVVKAQRDAEYGKPRPSGPDVPVPNPEDLLREEEPTGDLGGGPPGEGAPEGSTPSTPATEATGRDAETANLAVVGSTPTSLPSTQYAGIPQVHIPSTEGETTMKRRKDGKRMPEPWTCPKCKQTFIQPGRHAKSCTGKAQTDKPARKRSAPEAGKARVTPEVARQNGHGVLEDFAQVMQALTAATGALLTHVKNLEGETQLYRRENEELRTFKQRASALFETSPKVPRG